MTYDQIPGWFDFEQLFDEMVGWAKPNAVFVEVGSYLGRSTAYLASRIKRSGKNIRLYVVDLWDGWFYDDFRQQTPMPAAMGVYQQFLDNMKQCGVDQLLRPLQMPSERAAALFADRSLDFVWIDADHGYQAVRSDLRAWFPKVQKRGFLGGHDYCNKDFPGVRQAVDEFFGGKPISFRPITGYAGGSFLATRRRSWLRRALRYSKALCRL